MALSCPNKSLPEWKRLVDEVGEREALNDYFQFGTIRSPYAVKDKLERLNIANYTNKNFKIGERYFKPTVESLIDVEKNSSVVDAMVTHFGYRGSQSEVEAGLVEEARSVYPFRDLNSLNTVGYKELFTYFDGTCSLEEAIDLIQRNTRKYARKQLTWFRRDNQIAWFEPNQLSDIINYVDDKIKIDE